MADFLTRLAGRTMGLAPTVQPILAPMYAAQPVAADNTFTSLSEEISGNLSRQEQISPSFIRSTQVEQAAPGERVHPQRIPLPADLPLQSLPEMTPAPQVRPSLIIPETPVETSAKPFGSSARAPLGETGTIDIPLVEQRYGSDLRLKSVKDARKSIEISEVLPVESPPQRPIRTKTPGASLLPGTIHLAETHITTPPRRVNGPEATLPLTSGQQEQESAHSGYRRRDTSTESQSPPTAPTIQVTIGRIEVRAAPPPTPRSQRSGPQVMGLDEYLNQRAKGGR